MIKVITYKDIEANYKLFIGQFQLRHREFLERQNYDVRSMDGLEFDSYDTIASVYLIYTEDGCQVLGLSRLTPVRYGCMLADHFAELVDDKAVFQSEDNIWEGTRFCIDRKLPPEQRQRICHQLVAAYLEFGLSRRIDRIIGLMPTIILRTVFERSGVSLDRLGGAQKIGEHAKVQAASITVTKKQLLSVRAITGLPPVLADALAVPSIQAA
jgi:N-acyl-L-homoserine lactone synthetase